MQWLTSLPSTDYINEVLQEGEEPEVRREGDDGGITFTAKTPRRYSACTMSCLLKVTGWIWTQRSFGVYFLYSISYFVDELRTTYGKVVGKYTHVCIIHNIHGI